MKILVIGDVHCTPGEIQDCYELLRLIKEIVKKYEVEHVIFLGDQHHCHNALDSRVVAFWTDVIHYGLKCRQTYLIGNHDFANPTVMQPHSMVAHKLVSGVHIVDYPNRIVNDYCAMPYYSNPIDFINDANKLKEQNPECEMLFCHQTFARADGGLGYFSKEEVEPSAIPFKTIWSGHIHTPMRLGKVFYPGAPRWRTLTDAETEVRNIYVLEEGKEPIAIPTNTHCIKIYKYDDSEAAPLSINLTEDELTRADIRITINGTSDYISHRMTELKAKYNAKCRGVPIRGRLAKASESEGISKAFLRFGSNFTPPNGTDKELLLKEAYGRIQKQTT
jgi:DNA repair exonuclease SbcCD nuclease subunit